MNIDILHNKEKKKFYFTIDGLEAHMMYKEIDESTLNYYHTFVPNELRGKKIAQKIVTEALEFALTNNKKIIPGCSFVQGFVQRNEKYLEVLKV